MIRTAASKAVLVAAGVLLAGAVAVNCSQKDSTTNRETIGSTELAIRLASGADVATVNYQITGNGITPITGAIAVTDPAATVSVLVSGIPAGMGYLVQLTAVSTNGNTMCSGMSMFNVTAGQTTMVGVTLQCRAANNNGSAVVTGGFNNCPVLTSYTASPLAVAVGGTIAVTSTATDADMGAVITYAWTATGGTFAAPGSASTSYSCSAPGAQTLTITVSDSQCNDSATIPVTCIPVACGNGMIDMGEQCDPPSAATRCDANCQIIPLCGNSIVERGEQCDPPNGVTCNATCQTIPIVCGNGILQPPTEQCEPPNTATCNAMCQMIQPPRCGDGMVTPPEQCEPPGTMTCDANCRTIDVCLACETRTCDPTLTGCAALATQADRDLCTAALACIRTTHCAAAISDALPCYCGTASDLGCLGGAGNGVCKMQLEAASKTLGTTPDARALDVAERFVDPAFPIGRAVNTITCDAATCRVECPL